MPLLPPAQSNGPSPRTFLQTVIRTLPLHVLATTSILGGAALFYHRSLSDGGTWAALGSWSLVGLSVIVGLAGGVVAGLLDASRRMVERLEMAIRDWLHTLPALKTTGATAGRDLATARQEYETLVDQAVAQAGRRLRLPQWLERLLRSALRGLVVDRFMASCTSRGIHSVAPQDFRNWLLAEGVSLGFMPLLDQLSWWRYVLLALLMMLAAVAIALAW